MSKLPKSSPKAAGAAASPRTLEQAGGRSAEESEAAQGQVWRDGERQATPRRSQQVICQK